MQIGTLIQAAKAPFFSLEFFPPSDEAQLPGFYATVEQLRALDPLFVSVTYGAGGARQHSTLAVTAELARRGFTTMAHIFHNNLDVNITCTSRTYCNHCFRYSSNCKCRLNRTHF